MKYVKLGDAFDGTQCFTHDDLMGCLQVQFKVVGTQAMLPT